MNKPRVTVIDYGAGNLLSVQRAFEHVGAEVTVTNDPDTVSAAERLVLPGVGAFGKAMEELRNRELIDPIVAVAESGRPLLGICLGMQLLLGESEEFGRHIGLGLIPGRVEAIPAFGADGQAHKIPHIGWSPLSPAARKWDGSVLDGIEVGACMYFVHSFTARPADPMDLLAVAAYDGVPVTAAVGRGNVCGFQPHPEKSAAVGLALLARFATGA